MRAGSRLAMAVTGDRLAEDVHDLALDALEGTN